MILLLLDGFLANIGYFVRILSLNQIIDTSRVFIQSLCIRFILYFILLLFFLFIFLVIFPQPQFFINFIKHSINNSFIRRNLVLKLVCQITQVLVFLFKLPIKFQQLYYIFPFAFAMNFKIVIIKMYFCRLLIFAFTSLF